MPVCGIGGSLSWKNGTAAGLCLEAGPLPRREPREGAYLADQVRLVVVACTERDFRPVDVDTTLGVRQRSTRAQDTSKALRGDANAAREPPRQMLSGNSEGWAKSGDREVAMRGCDATNGFDHLGWGRRARREAA